MVEHGFAAADVIETGRVSQSHVDVLRRRIAQEDLPDLTDEQLILFSLSCLNDPDETMATIRAYVRIKNACPAVFAQRRVLDLRSQLDVVELCVFPERTGDDCAVLFHRLRDTNFRNYNMETAMKLLFMSLDAAVYDRPPRGLVILFDMKGVSIWHLTRVKLGLVKVFFQYLQEALPVRLRRIHVLNTVYFLDKVIAIIKPFIKREVMEMIEFHSPSMDMEKFHELLPRRCLPEDLGGDLPEVHALHQRNVQKLSAMQSYFEAEEAQRATR